MLDEIGTNKELTEYITNYVYNNIEEDKGWKIDKEIKTLAKEILKERYREKKNLFDENEFADTKEKVNELITELRKIKFSFENLMEGKGKEAQEIITKHGLEITDFRFGTTGVAAYIINHLLKSHDYKPGARVIDAYEDRTKWYSKNSNKINDINSALNDGLDELLHSVIDFYENNKIKYYSTDAVLNTIYIIGIFEDLARKLKEYREANKILFISDINLLLERIITGDNCPFIYEKTGNKFKNYLIDEFQDTSNYQWKNFLPLVINSISENNFSMIVGDVKQAIYRWRNGNMKIMLEQVYNDLDTFNELIETKDLGRNFRSFIEIVNFNNKFFEIAQNKLLTNSDKEPGIKTDYPSIIKKTYKSIIQKPDEKKRGGYVNFTFYKPDDNDESPADKSKVRLIEIIDKALNDGYSLKDITVITRQNTEGTGIANLLAENGKKVISADSLLLINSPKIKLLVNAFRYIADNKDNLSKTELLYNFIRNIKKEEPDLNYLFTDYETDDLFTEEIPAEFFKYDDKSKIRPILNSLTIYELTENLVQIFGLSKEPDAYLLKFQDVILNYSEKYNNDLSSFLDWWEENNENQSITLPDELDAIKVMTIHKVKGLQKKIVIIPFANWDLNISARRDLILVSSSHFPFDKSNAYFVRPTDKLSESYFADDYLNENYLTKVDNLNLLYVAFTRASERLYVIVPKKRTANIGKVIETVITEIGELDSIYDGRIFESGKETKKLPDISKEKKQTLMLSEYISTEWYRKAIIRPKYQRIKVLKDEKLSQKILWGVLVHNLLSLIKTENDIDKAITNMQNEGVLDDSMKIGLSEKVKKILSDEKIKNWFSTGWEIKSESEILLQDGSRLRPDRVMIKDKNACVIDYKTGAEKEEDKRQVKKYADVLKTMGYEKVEKYLLYINDENSDLIKIVEL